MGLHGTLRVMRKAGAIGVLIVLWALPASAWGPEGHRLVARLAEARLTPAARARVAAILGPEVTLVSVANWADEVRKTRKETEPWHYINVPVSRPHLDLRRDCPDGDCILGTIREFQRVLLDPAAGPEQRRDALMFVVHFIGDLHQPLHCADNGDAGGNKVRVVFLGRHMNLHRVWDSGLLDRMAPEQDLFATLSRETTPERARQWSGGTVEDWADESFQAARRTAYGRLRGTPRLEPVRLGEAYERIAAPVVQVQLEKAGVRLAAVLNQLP